MAAKSSTFPTAYADLDTDQLISAYSAGPERVRQVIQGLKPADLKAHPREGKWSIQEIVVHLSDAEVMGAARIRQAFAQPGSTVAVYDQMVWAREMAYQDYDTKTFYTALMMFDALRLATAKLFQRATAADWEKVVIHPEWGAITLRQLLELYADHSERHIAQILTLRELLG
ncbi:MAG TPA: DinB family protein, partial [bacterium]